ncbi:MAG: hypothetical protein AABX51_02100, partial [Nanoarchaeota archaeon]
VGACVTSDKRCSVSTQQECLSVGSMVGGNNETNSIGYNFYSNVLCTSPELNTTCKRTEKTTCVDGFDEVYFVDSCGNPANIYDANKVNDDDYWSRVYTKQESCGASTSSSVCGNCNRASGSFCSAAKEKSPKYGDYICKDTSCTAGGRTYKNGESVCGYEGSIGNGDDTVGSRYWRYVCNMGEVQAQPCADYRGEICVQTTNSNGSYASCRINSWRSCIQATAAGKEVCEARPDCIWREMSIGKSSKEEYFQVKVCSPAYPPGFSFGDNSGSDVCGVGSKTCTVVYTKKKGGLFGGGSSCKAKINKECEAPAFTDKMNDICRTLGDCGGYVNFMGTYTNGGYAVKCDGGKCSKTITSSIMAEYSAKAGYVANQVAPPDGYTGANNAVLAQNEYAASREARGDVYTPQVSSVNPQTGKTDLPIQTRSEA